MVNELYTIRIIVKGKVQGVYFRKYTRNKALEFGLEGEVRNLPDGSVSVYATGTESQLESLKAVCKTGPPAARVTEMSIEEVELKNYSGFHILK